MPQLGKRHPGAKTAFARRPARRGRCPGGASRPARADADTTCVPRTGSPPTSAPARGPCPSAHRDQIDVARDQRRRVVARRCLGGRARRAGRPDPGGRRQRGEIGGRLGAVPRQDGDGPHQADHEDRQHEQHAGEHPDRGRAAVAAGRRERPAARHGGALGSAAATARPVTVTAGSHGTSRCWCTSTTAVTSPPSELIATAAPGAAS